MSDYDTLFSLPAVDDPPSTEVGVILLGLDADRLLAGLGMAGESEDPARVTLLVEQARHGVPTPVPLDAAVSEGCRRWRLARAELAGVQLGSSAALRQAWQRAYRALDGVTICEPGSATHAYLTACWLRRDEVDRHAAAAYRSTDDQAG